VSPSPYALPMASLDLSRLVEKVVGYPQLVEMDDRQRRELHEALLDAHSFEDLPGRRRSSRRSRTSRSCGSSPASSCAKPLFRPT
jgi:hypothetical protein